MYVVYLSCDFVTKMIIKKNWKSSLISGLWFGIVQFLNRNIQACESIKKASNTETAGGPFFWSGAIIKLYICVSVLSNSKNEGEGGASQCP